jgi:hypothetical protein
MYTMIGPAIFAKLSSLDLPFNLTNPNGTLRIFPNYQSMRDKGYPAIVYVCDDYAPTDTMDGGDGVPTISVNLYAISEHYDDANTLGKALESALDATRGTWGETVVQGCFVDEVSESHFVDTDLETILYYQKELVLKVTYQE